MSSQSGPFAFGPKAKIADDPEIILGADLLPERLDQRGVHMRRVAERVPGVGGDALVPEMEVGGVPEGHGDRPRAKVARLQSRIRRKKTDANRETALGEIIRQGIVQWTEPCHKWPRQLSPDISLETVVSRAGFEPATH